jgi:hypothetical protein
VPAAVLANDHLHTVFPASYQRATLMGSGDSLSKPFLENHWGILGWFDFVLISPANLAEKNTQTEHVLKPLTPAG